MARKIFKAGETKPVGSRVLITPPPLVRVKEKQPEEAKPEEKDRVVPAPPLSEEVETPVEEQRDRLLEEAGCEIVRVGVPDEKSAMALKRIKAGSGIPVIADVHFSKKLSKKSMCSSVNSIARNNMISGSA